MLLTRKPMPYAFQPIIDLNTNSVYGYEALMRPSNSTPDNYIRRHRLPSGEIDTHAIEYITFFSALHYARGLNGKIFVNSFPNTALTDKELDLLVGLYGEKLFSQLVIEMLEYPYFSAAAWMQKARQIRELGCLVAIDDYGAGINNDDIIRIVKPDIVKLDSFYIRLLRANGTADGEAEEILEKFFDLNAELLVEGIETYEDYRHASDRGASYGQGYYFSKPKIRTEQELMAYLLASSRAC